jgi:endonuclease/exonuclease/phosphatase family metal-dependent hydrolase
MYKKSLVIFILLLVSLLAYSQSTNLKVLTFNIRYDNPSDGAFSWKNRKAMVFHVLESNRPDIAGLQEALKGQVDEIARALPGYTYSGVGRDDGAAQGEFSPIFYDSVRFKRKDGATFWLSETPDKPGSKSWNAACTRIVTWIKLYDRHYGKTIFVFNTHFDHASEEARIESAKYLISQIKRIAGNEIVILMGDFNSNESDQAYHILTDPTSAYPLCNSREIAGKKSEGPAYSFVGFPFHPDADGIIDFIFISKSSSLKVRKNRVIDYHKGDKYPSDHLPVLTEFEY